MNGLTRTANLYFMNRGKVYVAVDDEMHRYLKQFESTTKENEKNKLYKNNLIRTCSVDQMMKTFWENNQWAVERREVKDLLDKSHDLGRVFSLMNCVRSFDLTTVAGKDEFANDKAARAYFGDVAPEYAEMGNPPKAEIRLITPMEDSYRYSPDHFEDNLKGGKVVIRAVTLGGLENPGIMDGHNFEHRGLVRAIFQPSSYKAIPFPSQK